MNTHAKDWFAFIALWCLCGLSLHGEIEAAAFVSCFTWLVSAYMLGQAAAVFAAGWSAQAVTKAQATKAEAQAASTQAAVDAAVSILRMRDVADATRNTRHSMTL